MYGGRIRAAAEGAKLLQEASLIEELDANIAFLPIPELPEQFVSVIENTQELIAPDVTKELVPIDARLQNIHLKVLEAWAVHMEQRLQHSTVMFSQLLKAFMSPYYMTIIMYTTLFLVGIGLFITTACLSTRASEDLSVWLFGGLGVITFLAFFISRPLAALDENLLLITRLGVIYNTYWTRLLYMQGGATIQADLEDATTDAITELDKLTDKGTEQAQNRPELGVR